MPKIGEIPQEEIDFCRKLGQLAKEHGALRVNIEYEILDHDRPERWSDPIKIQWHRGRHSEEASMSIESMARAYVKV